MKYTSCVCVCVGCFYERTCTLDQSGGGGGGGGGNLTQPPLYCRNDLLAQALHAKIEIEI